MRKSRQLQESQREFLPTNQAKEEDNLKSSKNLMEKIRNEKRQKAINASRKKS